MIVVFNKYLAASSEVKPVYTKSQEPHSKAVSKLNINRMEQQLSFKHVTTDSGILDWWFLILWGQTPYWRKF